MIMWYNDLYGDVNSYACGPTFVNWKIFVIFDPLRVYLHYVCIVSETPVLWGYI